MWKRKQREKKKKDNAVDSPDHAKTQPEMVKDGRKEKAPGDPETPVEPETFPQDPSAEKKKKKKRKRDREGVEHPSDDKTKKRREGTSGTVSELATDSPLEAAVTTPGAKERKKRRKSKSSTGASDLPATDPALDADAEHSSKSKLKSKKRKKETIIEDEGNEATAVSAESHPSKKRKKSKRSIYPDPSDDPDLTEQSRKALVYIYSQHTSPETWKFNKARQNWIIRNIWSSKIQEKYVTMLVEYLSKVQGRVRETIIESCKEIVSGPNPEPPAGANEESSPGGANPPIETAAENEKRKRAEILLNAFVKSQF